jgi:hypothetical protein
VPLENFKPLIINNNHYLYAEVGKKYHHEHIPDREDDFKREITVCIYRKDDLSRFDERSRKLIQNDE